MFRLLEYKILYVYKKIKSFLIWHLFEVGAFKK